MTAGSIRLRRSRPFWQGSAPVGHALPNVSGHGPCGFAWVPGKERFHHSKVLGGFGGHAMIVAMSLMVGVGDITESPEQHLQAAQFVCQERIPTGIGHEVVQPAVKLTCFIDVARLWTAGLLDVLTEVVGEGAQHCEIDTPASMASCLTFQGATHLADFTHFAGRHAANHCPTVRQQINDPNARQGNECFADGRMADPEPFSQFLGNEVLPSVETALKNIGQQTLHDRLTALATIAMQGGSWQCHNRHLQAGTQHRIGAA